MRRSMRRSTKSGNLGLRRLGTVALVVLFFGGATALADDARHHPPGPGTFSVHNLKGRYVTSGTAYDASITGTSSEPNPPAVPFVAAGFLQFDGAGNITAGEETINYGSPGTGDSFTCELAGTYTLFDATKGTYILTLNVTPGPAVTPAESTGPTGSNSQCSGTATHVGYLSDPSGKRLNTVEQTPTGGTPTPPAASTTPILSAHVWTKFNE